MNQPSDLNQWTDEQREAHLARLRRYKQLAADLINLTIQKHGSFSMGPDWIGLERFEPGSRTIQVDGHLSFKDLEILKALLQLPSMEYEDLETFNWDRFDTIRHDLIEAVVAMGQNPDLRPVEE